MAEPSPGPEIHQPLDRLLHLAAQIALHAIALVALPFNTVPLLLSCALFIVAWKLSRLVRPSVGTEIFVQQLRI